MILPGSISALVGVSLRSHTTPSFPVAQVGTARPQRAMVRSAAECDTSRSMSQLHLRGRPAAVSASHQAPQSFSASSSMRSAGRPCPASSAPASEHQPRA